MFPYLPVRTAAHIPGVITPRNPVCDRLVCGSVPRRAEIPELAQELAVHRNDPPRTVRSGVIGLFGSNPRSGPVGLAVTPTPPVDRSSSRKASARYQSAVHCQTLPAMSYRP